MHIYEPFEPIMSPFFLTPMSHFLITQVFSFILSVYPVQPDYTKNEKLLEPLNLGKNRMAPGGKRIGHSED